MALPARVSRYGVARRGAVRNLAYLDALANEPARGVQRRHDPVARAADRLRGCGEYLLFRHYWTVDQVRLHAAHLCQQSLLCPLCAIRRSSKLVGVYLARFEVIRAERPELRPVLLTYTVRNGPDLAERMAHLRSGLRRLTEARRDARTRGKRLDGTWRHLAGAVGALEATWNPETGWHPHWHGIGLCDGWMDHADMQPEWKRVTGDSHIVRIQRLDPRDPAKAFCEALKYSVKFSGMHPAQVWEAAQVLKRQRLVTSLGCFRGVQVPDALTDEPLDQLPFVELLYRYLGAGHYGLDPSRR